MGEMPELPEPIEIALEDALYAEGHAKLADEYCSNKHERSRIFKNALQERERLEKAILAALAAAKEEGRREEREACAKIADDERDNRETASCAWDSGSGPMGYEAACCEIENKIRARSVKP